MLYSQGHILDHGIRRAPARSVVARPALAPGITDSSTRLVLTPEHARLSLGTADVAAPVEESSQVASAGAA